MYNVPWQSISFNQGFQWKVKEMNHYQLCVGVFINYPKHDTSWDFIYQNYATRGFSAR